jgi:hypothetical protein
MNTTTRTIAAAIVKKHIDAMAKELENNGQIGLGFFPDDNGGLVAVVMGALEHQFNIDDYHCREQTDFTK